MIRQKPGCGTEGFHETVKKLHPGLQDRMKSLPRAKKPSFPAIYRGMNA
jgi:hypothetical protein